MRFKYCPECGAKLIARSLGDEGLVPWCEQCDRPWFDMFSSCVISLVYNDEGEVVLLHQDYISTTYCNLVSGYIKPGETAEQCALREVEEEIGVKALDVEPVGTWWFGKKDMLMLGFFIHANKTDLKLSCEVNSAQWVSADKAINMVHPAGSVSHALVQKFLENKK